MHHTLSGQIQRPRNHCLEQHVATRPLAARCIGGRSVPKTVKITAPCVMGISVSPGIFMIATVGLSVDYTAAGTAWAKPWSGTFKSWLLLKPPVEFFSEHARRERRWHWRDGKHSPGLLGDGK